MPLPRTWSRPARWWPARARPRPSAPLASIHGAPSGRPGGSRAGDARRAGPRREPREGGAVSSARPPPWAPSSSSSPRPSSRSTRRTRGRTCRVRMPTPSGSSFWGSAVEVPGPAVDRLVAACREHDVLCAIGVNERELERPGSVYNTLLLLGPEGLLSRHRKLMPTHHERLFHGVGAGDDLGVTETRLGRIGGLICWENRMPLARWAVYQGGPQIWLAPTADDSEGGWPRSGTSRSSPAPSWSRSRSTSSVPRSPTTSRGRCPTTRSSVAAARPSIAPGVGRRASPARSTTRRGSSWPMRPARDAAREALVRRGRSLQPADVLWPGGALTPGHPLDKESMTRRIRIGIDTGGTFTDVVAFDEDTGELVTTKTPSTPGNPADGFLAGIDKVLGPARGDRRGHRRGHRTAPRSRPTSCSRARSTGSASSPTPATRRCSRSPGSRCPTATATPTSG